jgi:hypothetical protein
MLKEFALNCTLYPIFGLSTMLSGTTAKTNFASSSSFASVPAIESVAPGFFAESPAFASPIFF